MVQAISPALSALATGLSPAQAGPASRDTALSAPLGDGTSAPPALDLPPSGADAATRASGMRADTAPVDATTLAEALQLVNSNLQAWSTGLRFDMDDEAQRLVASITDSETGEVLRTIPSDAVLRVAKMIVKLQGTQVDTHA